MKLEFIKVENFKQYYGEQDADFSTASDVNVSVFHGLNGAGKTSLFSAINWCLYDYDSNSLGDIINRRAIQETLEGEKVAAKVVVAFLHKGHRFIARKVIEGQKKGKSVVILKTVRDLSEVKASGDIKPIKNAIGQMNAVLPENVRQYFFFDGEKLDDLTKIESTDVEDAIRNIIRLPALERGEKHLSDVAGEFRRQIKREATGEIETLISQEEDLRGKKANAQERREELKEEIKLARGQVQTIEEKLRDSEQASQRQKRRDEIKEQLTQLQDMEDSSINRIQQLTNRSFPVFLRPQIQEALSIINIKRERGEIPSGIREQFLEDLLEGLECVCGRPFERDDAVFKKLTALLERSTPSDVEEQVIELGGDLRSLAKSTSDWVEDIDRVMADRAKIQQGLEKYRRELDDIKRKIEGDPLEEIAGLERNRTKFQKNLEVYLHEDGGLTTRLNDIDRAIEEVRKKLQQAEAKQEKLSLLVKKEDISQKAADAVAKITAEFIEDARRNVESITKEIFQKLAWKEDQFQDVTVSEDFRMEVIDRWGAPTRKELSAGERQVLSLSFICAMAQISGEEANRLRLNTVRILNIPLIIDQVLEETPSSGSRDAWLQISPL